MNLSHDELSILIYGLNAINSYEEKRLSQQYGSVSALYNKLFSELEKLDRNPNLKNLVGGHVG